MTIRNIIVAQCENCKAIGWNITYKSKYFAYYTCFFCKSKKKLCKEDPIMGVIFNIPCFYFGPNKKIAEQVIRKKKQNI